MSELQNALLLMLIGMLTVSAILTVIVLIGNGVIAVSNRLYSPQIASNSNDGINLETITVLAATVDQLTEGRGRIENIEKLTKAKDGNE